MSCRGVKILTSLSLFPPTVPLNFRSSQRVEDYAVLWLVQQVRHHKRGAVPQTRSGSPGRRCPLHFLSATVVVTRVEEHAVLWLVQQVRHHKRGAVLAKRSTGYHSSERAAWQTAGSGVIVDAAQTALINLVWYLLSEAEHCSKVENRVPLIQTLPVRLWYTHAHAMGFGGCGMSDREHVRNSSTFGYSFVFLFFFRRPTRAHPTVRRTVRYSMARSVI